MVRPCSLTPIGLCFLTEAFNLSNSPAVNEPSKHLRWREGDTCQSQRCRAQSTHLKLVDLVVVEHAVLVHVAQLEDALEGLDALGLELLRGVLVARGRGHGCATSSARSYSTAVG